MLFNSAEFLFLFLPLAFLLHFFIRNQTGKLVNLIVLSAWFYMSAFPLYMFILIGLIVVDYGGALLMSRCSGLYRKIIFWLCIGSNVALLASFKYWNFLAENLNLTGISLPLHDWILPVGLSFHTFQSLSYLTEVFRGAWPAEKSLLRYSLYILFFPQMVAGPIERPQNILPQFVHFQGFRKSDFAEGLFLLARGLFMKAAVADRLSLYVNPIFERPGQVSGEQALLAVLFFTLQIYADFSGYSNMALGSARLLGIQLMVNFRQPYLAGSLSDFWRRWHVSLSTWFRDYLYIPLGGNRCHPIRAGLNLLLVFLVSGLWHGAGWNFILWGILHGAGLVAENSMRSAGLRMPSVPSWIFTQFWVMFCWIFFRAVSLDDAVQLLSRMVLGWHAAGISLEFSANEIGYGLLLALLIPLSEYFRWPENLFRPYPAFCLFLLFTATYFLGNFKAGSFLYFQF